MQKIGIHAGDEYESYVFDNRITIIKKTKGVAKAMLKNIDIDNTLSDVESLQSTL